MECRFSLRLEGDDNETNEDVDHKEGNDDQVDKVEEEDIGTVVLLGSNISFVGVDGDIQDSKHRSLIEIFAAKKSRLISFCKSNIKYLSVCTLIAINLCGPERNEKTS